MSDFPLCKAAGLETFPVHIGGPSSRGPYIAAADVEAYLKKEAGNVSIYPIKTDFLMFSNKEETVTEDMIREAAEHPVWGLRGNSEKQFVEACQAQMDEGPQTIIHDVCTPKANERNGKRMMDVLNEADPPRTEFFKPENFDFSHFPPQMDIRGCAAAIANRLLQERSAKVSFRENPEPLKTCGFVTMYVEIDGHTDDASKFDGLLLNVKPRIQPDTAEQILKDIIEWSKECGIVEYTGSKPPSYQDIGAFFERAKKLLGEK